MRHHPQKQLTHCDSSVPIAPGDAFTAQEGGRNGWEVRVLWFLYSEVYFSSSPLSLSSPLLANMPTFQG